MSQWIVVPIVLPMLTAAALLIARPLPLAAQRVVSIAVTAALIPVGALLVIGAADGDTITLAIGGWPPPFGITLAVDRLAAVMVLLTSVVALPCALYAAAGEDAQGRFFHPLFQLQLMGLNGAFLTGDLFNLFVFFEILLTASYALLMHGHGAERSRAAVHLVTLNVVGSAVFLLGIGALYGAAGTLNLADLARVVPGLEPGAASVARIGALLVLVVFALKSALLPLTFWLPQSYSAAAAPVAALFTLMTKVGAYAILRVYTLAFDGGTGLFPAAAAPWVLPAALTTIVLGVLGALAAATLRDLAVWLLVVSIGTLFAAVGLFNEAGFTAAIYYAVHSTLATAALFLVADLVRRQRAKLGDRLHGGEPVRQPALLATMFAIAAMSVVGLPPLSGFVGKILILRASWTHEAAGIVWTIVLAETVPLIVVLARAGSALFWKTGGTEPEGLEALGEAHVDAVPSRPVPAGTATAREGTPGAATPFLRVLATAVPLAAGILLVVFGAQATRYAAAASHQLVTPEQRDAPGDGPAARLTPASQRRLP